MRRATCGGSTGALSATRPAGGAYGPSKGVEHGSGTKPGRRMLRREAVGPPVLTGNREANTRRVC